MKIVKGWGLLASVLTLIHGLYLASYFVWVFVLILFGLSRYAPPVLNSLLLAIIDTAVYLFLGVGMLRDKRSYFVYGALWTIWGAILATFVATYKGSLLNLLSFLIAFFCTYYHVSVNRTNPEVAKKLRQFAGVLALTQGVIIVFVLLSPYTIIIAPRLDELILAPTFTAVAVTAVIYLVLGVGILMGKKEFILLAIFWALAEAALAIANVSYMYTHYNVISIIMVAFATYYYFSKTRS